MIDVESYLTTKGLHLKRAGADNVHTSCFFCHEDPSKRGRLYINVGGDEQLAGLYMCHRCGEKGNIRTLRRHFGDPDLDAAADLTANFTAIMNAAAEFYVAQLDAVTIDWLKGERGLSEDTIQRHQIGRAPGGAELGRFLHNERSFDLADIRATGLVVERGGRHVDFLQRNITIPYHVQGSVVQIRGKEVGGKYFTPPGQKARLFNTDVVWGAEDVFITEGEFDALVLEQQGYAAMGAPGAKSWQDTWTGYLEDARRVFCVFDNDRAGEEGAQKLKEVIGPKLKRLLLPTMADGTKQDVSDWMVTAGASREEFDGLVRDSVMRDSILVSPIAAKQEWDELQGLDGYKLGWEKLDSFMKGILPAQVLVLLAKTNVGKTLSLLNLFQLSTMRQPKSKILFVSLEQTRGDWFERARRIWNFYNLECPAEDVNAETLLYWQPRLRLVDKNRVSEDEMHAVLEEYRLEMGQLPDLVAVDYLGYWASGFKGKSGRYEQVSDAVMALKAIAKDWRVPIIAPHQVSRVAEFGKELSIDQARDSGAVEETADHIIGLWSADSVAGVKPDDRTGILHAKIGKTRAGGKGQEMALQFGPLSLVMVDVENDERGARNARIEVPWSGSADVTWEQAIRSHATAMPVVTPSGKYQRI